MHQTVKGLLISFEHLGGFSCITENSMHFESFSPDWNGLAHSSVGMTAWERKTWAGQQTDSDPVICCSVGARYMCIMARASRSLRSDAPVWCFAARVLPQLWVRFTRLSISFVSRCGLICFRRNPTGKEKTATWAVCLCRYDSWPGTWQKGWF